MADGTSPIAEFNHLVREAYVSQEIFDRFDPQTAEDQEKLIEIIHDWNETNRALIQHVLDNHEDLFANTEDEPAKTIVDTLPAAEPEAEASDPDAGGEGSPS